MILVIGVIKGLKFYDSSMQLASYQSPDGNYELIIKNDRIPFLPTMPGDGGRGSLPVKVILKNANGKIIGTSNSDDNCGIFMGSILVEWDLENEQVWYAKARTINIKTGKVEC